MRGRCLSDGGARSQGVWLAELGRGSRGINSTLRCRPGFGGWFPDEAWRDGFIISHVCFWRKPFAIAGGGPSSECSLLMLNM
jgi:hypothetical protein